MIVKKQTPTAKHIGIVACSAEGAALCYRTICLEALSQMGEHDHPRITLHSIPMAEYMPAIVAGDWQEVAELLLVSAEKVANAGADFAICPDNTCHQAFDYLSDKSPLPWLHIADEMCDQASRKGFRRLGILGTKYLMESLVYPKAAARFGIHCLTPEMVVRERINTIIFKELVNGHFRENSRLYFNQVMKRLKSEGCDAAVLGCTEIPLVVDPNDVPLPILDSTRCLAEAALKRALAKE